MYILMTGKSCPLTIGGETRADQARSPLTADVPSRIANSTQMTADDMQHSQGASVTGK
jgi:hypothetical protein